MLVLIAPGAMLPLSNEPSFMTMRCIVLSLFCQTTRLPWGIGAGLGLKDRSFLWPMMLTITADDVDEVGEGIGLDAEPPLPHPHAARASVATASNWDRMTVALRKPNADAGAHEFAERAGQRTRSLTEAVRIYVWRRSLSG